MAGTCRVGYRNSGAQPRSLSNSLPPWKKLAWGWREDSVRASCRSSRPQIQIPRAIPVLGGKDRARASQPAKQPAKQPASQPASQAARPNQWSLGSKSKQKTNDRQRQPTLTSASTRMFINMFTTHTHKHVHTYTSHTQTKQEEKEKAKCAWIQGTEPKVKPRPSAGNHQLLQPRAGRLQRCLGHHSDHIRTCVLYRIHVMSWHFSST